MRFAKLCVSFVYVGAITVCVMLSKPASAAMMIVVNPIAGTGNYNLAPNGDFNLNQGAWGIIPTEPYGTFGWSGSEGFNGLGSRVALPQVPRSGPGFVHQREVTGLIPNQPYVLSGAFKVDDINAGQLYIDGGNTYAGYLPINNPLGFKPTGWFFAYNVFTPTGTNANIRFIRDSYGNDLQGGGYVDEIAVTPLASFVAPISTVPEPSSLILAPLGLGLYALVRRRRKAVSVS